jgi:hypothetical protein
MKDKTATIFWSSDTHHGSIQHYDAGGILLDLCFWAGAAEIKTGRREHDLPYDSVEAAVKRLTQKYEGFHVVSGPEAAS